MITQDNFRQYLYANYRSKFKMPPAVESSGEKRVYEAYCRRRFLRRLDVVDRKGPVLDIGCGEGRFVKFLLEAGFSGAEGVDASVEQIQHAQSKMIPVSHGDIFQFLNSSPLRYQAITAIDVLEHFTRSEQVNLVQLVYGALLPGGLFLFQTPNGDGLLASMVIYGDLTHCGIMSESSVRQLMNHGGLQTMSVDASDPVVTGPFSLLRSILWRMIAGVATAAYWAETGRRRRIWTQNIIGVARKPR